MATPSPAAEAPSTPPALQWALAVFFILGAGAVLVAQAVQFDGGPPQQDWAAAAAQVRADLQPGDGFLIAPQWQDGARVELQEAPWMPAEAPTWADLASYQRLWLLAEAGREEAAQASLEPWMESREVGRFGEVTLLLATPRAGNPEVTWDIFQALPAAEVTRERPGADPLPCSTWSTLPSPAWRCAGSGAWIGETLQVVTNDNHRCVWGQPADAGGALRLRWPAAALGARLEGHYGQTIDAIRSNRGAPVTFEVYVNSQPVHAHTFELHDEGFLPWEAPLSGTTGADLLEIVIRSEDPADRLFCFTLRATR